MTVSAVSAKPLPPSAVAGRPRGSRPVRRDDLVWPQQHGRQYRPRLGVLALEPGVTVPDRQPAENGERHVGGGLAFPPGR